MKTTILKYAAAATLAGTLALAAATPGQAREGRNAAAAIGFGAGALVGAAVASSYNNGYYGPSYGYAPGYAYESGYAYEPAPVYVEPYAYEPAPAYRYGYRSYSNGRDDSINSQR
ncbi:MAG: hypothetical protein HYX37_08915 [Rhizobiales bacterium]|nr:hypothetical protein [Hyphomicrobiales bacterium]